MNDATDDNVEQQRHTEVAPQETDDDDDYEEITLDEFFSLQEEEEQRLADLRLKQQAAEAALTEEPIKLDVARRRVEDAVVRDPSTEVLSSPDETPLQPLASRSSAGETSEPLPPVVEREQTLGLSGLVKLSDAERVECEGNIVLSEKRDPFLNDNDQMGGEEKRLEVSDILSAGLGPKYRIVIDNVTAYFSDTFDFEHHGRDAVYIFMPSDSGKGLVARTYYRSNSQGVWRYLARYDPLYKQQEPDYDGEPERIGVRWFDKMTNEERINAPFQIQHALADLQSATEKAQGIANPEFFFAGTAIMNTPEDIQGRWFGVEPANNASLVIRQENPSDLEFGVTGRKSRFTDSKKLEPKSLTILPAENGPDFSKTPLASWVQPTSMYGDVRINVLPSLNEKYAYLFCEAQRTIGSQTDTIAWVGGIENLESPIIDTATHSKWVDGHDITTPPYEYRGEQSANYENYDDVISGFRNYVGVFDKYVSNIPVVDQYLRRVVAPRDDKAEAPEEISTNDAEVDAQIVEDERILNENGYTREFVLEEGNFDRLLSLYEHKDEVILYNRESPGSIMRIIQNNPGPRMVNSIPLEFGFIMNGEIKYRNIRATWLSSDNIRGPFANNAVWVKRDSDGSATPPPDGLNLLDDLLAG